MTLLAADSDKKEKTARVKALAKETGFDVVGITKPAFLEEGEAAIAEWVKENRHGKMKYMEEFKQRRDRFFEAFGDAKSIIVLGVNYYSGKTGTVLKDLKANQEPSLTRETASNKLKGRIARYAWGKDYHHVICQKHEELIDRLKEIFGADFHAQSCVDTQPVPERFAARQAGLGFVGKHTGLLNQKFGPWLFLSEIVTNLDLEEDIPSHGDCGTCDHCQKVCPTGALDEDYKIDARRCIAYLTIEHKGIIPRELRPFIKDWIFGCDECLNVCPFTSKSKETGWKEFQSQSGFGEWLDIERVFELDSNSKYEKKFFGTALLRAGRKQMLRNTCIVLGNSQKKEALPFLEKALQDRASLVRLHAAWGLGQIPDPQAKNILTLRLSMEQDPDVLQEISLALSQVV